MLLKEKFQKNNPYAAYFTAPAMNSLPNKYNGMRRGVQVSFEERNPTRDTGTVQRVCVFDINTKYKYRWGRMELLLI